MLTKYLRLCTTSLLMMEDYKMSLKREIKIFAFFFKSLVGIYFPTIATTVATRDLADRV